MFGHQDDKPEDNDQNPAQPADNNQSGDDNTIVASPINHPLSGDGDEASGELPPTEHPKPAPVADDDANNDNNTEDKAGEFIMDDAPDQVVTEGATESSAPTTPPAPADDNGLIDIKQDALQQLSPLVGQLDQTPEEKFRTIMMLIQASDNKSLIKDAYDAAKGITDDKERAQALLDIVNEINYFTHQQN